MNFAELTDIRRRHLDSVVERFLSDGSQGDEVQDQVRAKAESIVQAEQDKEFEAAVAAQIEVATKAAEPQED